MSIFDGFVIPVPRAKREAFLDHAGKADAWFIEHGALRVVECWEDEVPAGKVTDFRRAVQAGDDEAIVFSRVEWPDKATHEAAMAKMMSPDNDDSRVSFAVNPPPFDGKRLIYGTFTPVVDVRRD